MDFFEELDKKEEQKESKEFFIKNYKRTIKITSITLLSVLIPLGLFFIIMGISLIELERTILYVFLPIGIILILIPIIVSICINKIDLDKAYEKNQTRIKNGKMPMSYTEAFYRIINLEHAVARLKEEVNSLKKK